MLGPCWGHVGTMLGPCWDHAGILPIFIDIFLSLFWLQCCAPLPSNLSGHLMLFVWFANKTHKSCQSVSQSASQSSGTPISIHSTAIPARPQSIATPLDCNPTPTPIDSNPTRLQSQSAPNRLHSHSIAILIRPQSIAIQL